MRFEKETTSRPKLERTADRGEYASDRNLNFENAKEKRDKVFAEAIKEKDFIGKENYSKEDVNRDLQYVKETEASFKKETDEDSKKIKELAQIFEAIICDQGELANWFGESAVTVKSARYDDLKNGIDLIIEFECDNPEDSRLALAVDITFDSFDKLHEKLDRIKRGVEEGKLSYVKYFNSEITKTKGDIRGIPKTVIGADPKTLYKLMDLWVNEEEKKLEKHPIQFMILDQIMAQLTKFKELAESGKKSFIAEKYGKVIEVVSRIIEEKQDLREEVLGDDDSITMSDRVHREIIGYIENMGPQKGPRVWKY